MCEESSQNGSLLKISIINEEYCDMLRSKIIWLRDIIEWYISSMGVNKKKVTCAKLLSISNIQTQANQDNSDQTKTSKMFDM